MKRVFLKTLVLAVFVVAIAFTSCGGGGGGGGGKSKMTMTMTTTADRISFTISGTGKYTVELDGKEVETGTFSLENNTVTSRLNLGSARKIAITGDNIISLECYGNELTSLDVSKNTALTKLLCGGNQLTSLDVSKNTALTELQCGNNQLTSLDVSKNTALTELWCGNNQLTSLDVSKNTALAKLWCEKNQLTSLDVSKNASLMKLNLNDNKFSVSAINAIFEALPSNSGLISIWDNPGDRGCNENIVRKKGWQFVMWD